MAIVSSLTAFCDMLRSQIGSQVLLGFPDDTVPGIYVWPWLLQENTITKHFPSSTNPDDKGPKKLSPIDVHVLILVRPALTIDGLSKLEAVRQTIRDRPILDISEELYANILIDNMDGITLSALFSSASLPFTICLSVVLHQMHK